MENSGGRVCASMVFPDLGYQEVLPNTRAMAMCGDELFDWHIVADSTRFGMELSFERYRSAFGSSYPMQRTGLFDLWRVCLLREALRDGLRTKLCGLMTNLRGFHSLGKETEHTPLWA